MLIGTVEDDIFVDPQHMPKYALPSVFSDFGCAFSAGSAEWTKAKAIDDRVDQIADAAQITLIHPFRAHTKLLVLDLDHTLMDISATKTSNDIPISRFHRPYIHEFLKLVHQRYDIGIWSQTSWRWIEIKLTELGMLTTPDYCINFILDKTSMFSVPDQAKPIKVKALDIIWRSFPGRWHAKNTLHVDDLERNFKLNPLNGIVISRYDCQHAHAPDDQELVHLAKYLLHVCADLYDVTQCAHTNWTTHRSTS
ncbi:HAD hydrolase, family IIID, variant 2 [Aphanomyces astaci]|nr:HAD hydrolase, family IIID, variant 2 [Aphanomyces astaci]ETV75995.1 HAD hydrolase, family IIID, variant 2 [Aphanomyces astaci]|eukprot:XP_009834635.1 HAD hydrolase, family IIID, variant 2 [Aphanomyces astaci]